MKLSFAKMQGAGNDFVIIDATCGKIPLDRLQLQQLADRRYGIGCDQVLVIEPARDTETDFHFRIYNRNGNEVEQCGNGARCIARYIHDRGLSAAKVLRLESSGGVVRAELRDDAQVTIDMGEPIFEPKRIPFVASEQADSYRLEYEGETFEIGALSMGNPHMVLAVSDLQDFPVSDIGAELERHPRFPNRVNVGFMEKVDAGHINLRVFERDAGETLACGTGACAAVVWGNLVGMLDSAVTVSLPGGELMVSWQGIGHPVYMTGPATHVFDGAIEI